MRLNHTAEHKHEEPLVSEHLKFVFSLMSAYNKNHGNQNCNAAEVLNIFVSFEPFEK